MQVEVHDVDAEIAGPRLADERVHVGAIHIKEARLWRGGCRRSCGSRSRRRRLWMGLVSMSAAVSVVDLRASCFDVDHAVLVGAQILDLVAADRGGRRIGAVRGVRDEDLAARIALRFVIGAGEQDAGELAVRAGGGLQGDGVHAGDFDEAAARACRCTSQRALRERFRLIGMRFGDALEARDELVDARVVLHGAATRADTCRGRWHSSRWRDA